MNERTPAGEGSPVAKPKLRQLRVPCLYAGVERKADTGNLPRKLVGTKNSTLVNFELVLVMEDIDTLR